MLKTKVIERYKPTSKTPFITYHGDQSRIDGYYSEVFAIIDNYLYDVKGFNEYEIYVSRIIVFNIPMRS